MDKFSLPLFVIDEQMQIVFANQPILNIFGNKVSVENFWKEKLSKVGINDKELTFDKLQKIVTDMFSGNRSIVEIFILSQYSYVAISKIMILDQSGKKEFVAVAIRGERN